jgi:glycosyltransferase involved in cell wall biosynthesis
VDIRNPAGFLSGGFKVLRRRLLQDLSEGVQSLIPGQSDDVADAVPTTYACSDFSNACSKSSRIAMSHYWHHCAARACRAALPEAMIGGAVPIVTDSGGSPELVQDGKSGFVVPPGEAQPFTDRILQLYNDRELHQRMSEAAQERIRTDFTVEETARQTIALYREMLAL